MKPDTGYKNGRIFGTTLYKIAKKFFSKMIFFPKVQWKYFLSPVFPPLPPYFRFFLFIIFFPNQPNSKIFYCLHQRLIDFLATLCNKKKSYGNSSYELAKYKLNNFLKYIFVWLHIIYINPPLNEKYFFSDVTLNEKRSRDRLTKSWKFNHLPTIPWILELP